jgi:bifunctional pyridoxal-dependent enzyme with beta-cystathionase and maltose regulon repressor activities
MAKLAKNKGEKVVFFEKALMRAMMIFVQNPQKPMHDILMSEPSYPFHKYSAENSQAMYAKIIQSIE